MKGKKKKKEQITFLDDESMSQNYTHMDLGIKKVSLAGWDTFGHSKV